LVQQRNTPAEPYGETGRPALPIDDSAEDCSPRTSQPLSKRPSVPPHPRLASTRFTITATPRTWNRAPGRQG
jgi:hypothetical protein